MCRSLADGPVPMYTPTVRGGSKMSVGMLCLGKHWNGLTYNYEDTRSDFDGLAGAADPSAAAPRSRSAAAADAGFEMRPDLCIMNYYTADAKMGVHQDKDERPETIAAGIPIVSVSLGDAARFVDRRTVAQGSDQPDDPALGRRAGDGRSVTPALSRRDAHPARHGARRHRSGTIQSDVPSVVSARREARDAAARTAH